MVRRNIYIFIAHIKSRSSGLLVQAMETLLTQVSAEFLSST